MVEKGKERTENRKFEIQKNRLTISAICQIHQKTENHDKEPCDDLENQPVKEAESRNSLAGRR